MAKKVGKFLLCTALISSAVAGGMALYNKYKASSDDFDDDFLDFDDDDDDDFDDDISDNSSSDPDKNRGYVSIPRDVKKEAATPDEKDAFKVDVDVKIDSSNSEINTADKQVEQTEDVPVKNLDASKQETQESPKEESTTSV